MSAPDDTFLSRWSRRKSQARGAAVPPEPAAAAPSLATAAPAASVAPVLPAPSAHPAIDPPAAAPPRAEPPPTLEDVAQLTRDSHFGRFVRADVDPTVKNAALRKLFADPQFNVMDGLDTYIDDYGKPDPLPAGMLRQMAQARLLGLFTDDPVEPDAVAADAGPAPAGLSAPAASNTEAPDCEPLPNEDTDLRLQPDDAAGCAGAGPGPGPHPGRER